MAGRKKIYKLISNEVLLTCLNPGVGAWTVQANILLKYIRPYLSILLWSLIWVSSYNLDYFYPLLFSPHQTNKGPNCLSISCSTLPSLITHALKILDIFQSGQQFIPEKWCWWALHPFQLEPWSDFRCWFSSQFLHT